MIVKTCPNCHGDNSRRDPCLDCNNEGTTDTNPDDDFTAFEELLDSAIGHIEEKCALDRHPHERDLLRRFQNAGYHSTYTEDERQRERVAKLRKRGFKAA